MDLTPAALIGGIIALVLIAYVMKFYLASGRTKQLAELATRIGFQLVEPATTEAFRPFLATTSRSEERAVFDQALGAAGVNDPAMRAVLEKQFQKAASKRDEGVIGGTELRRFPLIQHGRNEGSVEN